MWDLTNKGGPVYDVKIKCIVMFRNKENHLFEEKSFIQSKNFQRLNRSEKISIREIITDKELIEKIKLAKEENKNYEAFVYIQAEFIIPSELSIEKKSTRDTIYEIVSWNPLAKRFEKIRPDLEELFIGVIKGRNYLSIESMG